MHLKGFTVGIFSFQPENLFCAAPKPPWLFFCYSLPVFSSYAETLLAYIRVLILTSTVNFSWGIDSPTEFMGFNFYYASRFTASHAVNNCTHDS